MENSNFEDIFKKSGEQDRGFDFEESSWEDLEQRLEQPKKRRRFFWFWFFIPAILGTALFANMVLNSDAKLVGQSNISTQPKESSTHGTNAPSTTSQNLPIDLSKQQSILKDKNNNTLTNVKKPQSNKTVLKNIAPKTKIVSKVNQVKNTILKDNTSDNFTSNISVEEQEPQPKNIKHQQSTSFSKEEATNSKKSEVKTPPTKMENSTPSQKNIAISNPKALDNDLEGLGLNNTLNDPKLDIVPRDRKWEVGLSVGFTSVNSVSFIIRLTPDMSLAPVGSVATITTNHTGTEQNLYSLGFDNDLRKRIQPLYRLNIGREWKRNLLLRGGLILMRDTPHRKGVKQLIDDNPYDYSLQRGSISNYWLFDIGIHFQLRSNLKKFRPYLGLAPVFFFHHTQKGINNLYFNNEKIDKEKITTQYKGFNFAGLNAEGGIKYKITPRIDLGVSAFVFGMPFQNDEASYSGFSNPQLAASISFKL